LTQISPFDLFDTSDHEWIWRQFLVNNNVRDDLGRILDKMIEFGTRKRYQSAREILQDLTGQSPATSIQTPATPRYSPTPATPVIQTPPPPKVAANIVLKSARGVNYSKLQQLLAAGNWKEADEEINKLIQQKQMIIEKEGYPASDCIAVLRKEIKQEYNEEKAELIEKIKIAIREEVENSDEVYMSRIDNILDTFKQAEKIE
jgi:hypothetical protein